MKLSELKKVLRDYQFELLHGIIKKVEEPYDIDQQIDNAYTKPSERYNTFIFRQGFLNDMYSCVGIIVKDAELLRFRSYDGGTDPNATIEELREEIKIEEVEKYLKLYESRPTPSEICEMNICNVIWGDVWINYQDCRRPSFKKPAKMAAIKNSKGVYEVISNKNLFPKP